MAYASGKSTMSHPAAALNGSFHGFWGLRRDGPKASKKLGAIHYSFQNLDPARVAIR